MPGKRVPEDKRREDIVRAALAVAARDRLAGLTTRAVAKEAGTSHGLVFFHFKNRRELLSAVLDALLKETLLGHAVDETPRPDEAALQLAGAVRAALTRMPENRALIELFFDFWFTATREVAVRRRIRSALDRYRQSYLPLAEAAVREGFHGLPAEALARAAACFVEGCALDMAASTVRLDLGQYADAFEAMMRGGVKPGRSAAARTFRAGPDKPRRATVSRPRKGAPA